MKNYEKKLKVNVVLNTIEVEGIWRPMREVPSKIQKATRWDPKITLKHQQNLL
jgi:hypothetical protein